MARTPRAKPPIRLAVAAIAIGLFFVGYYWGNQHKRKNEAPPVIEGVLVRPPIEIPSFKLRDADGKAFTADSLRGHWTLLAFGDPSQATGYSTIRHMIEVRNRMATDPNLQEMLQLVLVAKRQDPTFARDFGRLTPMLRLLTGEPGELERLRTSLGAPVAGATKGAVDGPPDYLIGPAGRLLVLFFSAQPPASIASDFAAIVAHAGSLFPDKAQGANVPLNGASQNRHDALPPPDNNGDVERTEREFPPNG